jgi:hypothetical protein
VLRRVARKARGAAPGPRQRRGLCNPFVSGIATAISGGSRSFSDLRRVPSTVGSTGLPDWPRSNSLMRQPALYA